MGCACSPAVVVMFAFTAAAVGATAGAADTTGTGRGVLHGNLGEVDQVLQVTGL
jgi:hypothetical protein